MNSLVSVTEFNQPVLKIIEGSTGRKISVFKTDTGNIDEEVVSSFGEEWSKFHSFDEKDLEKISKEYFDILDENVINKSSYCIDIGCGSGRWTKSLLSKGGFFEAIDPSDAIFAADKLLEGADNVRLSKAATDNIPFPDETFDFGMSIGVLHHIPDTTKALNDCVKKLKRGGHFYVYLYYSLDNKGSVAKLLLSFVTGIRKVVSRLPAALKKVVCDFLAITLYMPPVLLSRFFYAIGFRKLAAELPLSSYRNKSFYIIRNDALDRFGTKLEQRFSRAEIIKMMQDAGLDNIIVSPNMPYWHAIGRRK